MLVDPKKKKSVIKFDNIYVEGQQTKVNTFYSISNGLYSTPNIQRMPSNVLDVNIRRISLEDMFRNRVKFLIHNAIINTFRDVQFVIVPDLLEYEYISNIHSYMGATESVILDFANVICMSIYNNYVESSSGQNLQFYNDLNKRIAELYYNLTIVLIKAHKEANTIYLDAGLPEIDLSSISEDLD